MKPKGEPAADAIKRGIAARRQELEECCRFIYENPELGFEEHCSAARLAEQLRALGFSVETPYAKLPTAFRAVLRGRGKGPKVAVLAEYDALQGLGHACGHNLIATSALAAAAGMAALHGEFPGQFEVIGTPAEERLAGKAVMVRRGAFKHLDAAFMAHPSNGDRITMGANANKSFTAQFLGKAAHAAGAPQDGLNALDAAVQFFNMANALRQHLREDERIHGIITRGGEMSNVIPELTEIKVGVRALEEDRLARLCRRVENAARGAALGLGCKVRIKWARDWYRSFKINLALDGALVDAFARQGIRLHQGAGTEARGSVDIANLSHELPASHPYFNIVPAGKSAALHTREFLELAGTPKAAAKAVAAGTALAETAAALLRRPALLASVKREFAYTKDDRHGNGQVCV